LPRDRIVVCDTNLTKDAGRDGVALPAPYRQNVVLAELCWWD
jgi:hypothetical protein